MEVEELGRARLLRPLCLPFAGLAPGRNHGKERCEVGLARGLDLRHIAEPAYELVHLATGRLTRPRSLRILSAIWQEVDHVGKHTDYLRLGAKD
eukprot:460089-Prymnesium_polylepis.2